MSHCKSEGLSDQVSGRIVSGTHTHFAWYEVLSSDNSRGVAETTRLCVGAS